MIEFKYKNIKFQFEYTQDDEILGGSNMKIPNSIILKYIEENSNFKLENCDLEHNIDELLDFCEYNGELVNWLEYKHEPCYISDTDLQIVLFNYILEDIEEEVIINYEGSNPYWVLHDLCHAEKDVISLQIYVDGYIENDRLLDGIELAKELNMITHINVELLDIIQESFNNRWNFQNIKFFFNEALKLINE